MLLGKRGVFVDKLMAQKQWLLGTNQIARVFTFQVAVTKSIVLHKILNCSSKNNLFTQYFTL
ncbi:MAG: hypothetical protein QNJ60_06125 [Xenococcaceae cyanobacterium MO_188.B19]|nr:hypothetical protein [Xenococcaceae cyanobacterium MO_188.B19]